MSISYTTMELNPTIISKCKILLEAYNLGKLGYSKMPEEFSPTFSENAKETRLTYFTLPMSLNYQRDSYKLWESALKTFNDSETRIIFDVQTSANIDEAKLRTYLTKYKVALQPNEALPDLTVGVSASRQGMMT